MAFFRSEKMSLCQMLLHSESAFECLIELGYLGMAQFLNFTDPEYEANLRYTNEVQRCSEMQRILKYLQSEIDDKNIRTYYYPDVDTEEVPVKQDVKDIELVLQQIEEELNNIERNYDVLRKKRSFLTEKRHVVVKAEELFTDGRNTETVMAWSDSIIMHLIRDETKKFDHERQLRLSYITGAIPVERYRGFELMLWRLCRSNFFLKRSDNIIEVEDQSKLSVKQRKFAFVVLFVGEVMRDKITKVCHGFHATLYEFPESSDARWDTRKKIDRDLEDLNVVLEQANEHKLHILQSAAVDLYIWKVKVKKILMSYIVLNKLGILHQLENEKYLQAECWIPTNEVKNVRMALVRGARRASDGDRDAVFPPILTEIRNLDGKEPPTYFRLNKFTRGFQNLIDAYGIAVYQELNPTPYSVITFPFLFAVMFGDIGHGVIMTLFAAWMIQKEVEIERKKRQAKSENEIFNLLFAGRYVILLMGIFSIYTGAIYNDVFSKAFNIFGSRWRTHFTFEELKDVKTADLNPETDDYLGTPYIFGMDPVWDASGEHAITTFNSVKMKLAIILGVSQMIFGLCLSAWNFVYSNEHVELYLVFLPQLVFLLCLFFYLVFLIFWKWIFFGGHNKPPYNSACAPSILIIFINMILMKGDDVVKEGCNKEMFDHQGVIQYILVFTAFAAVPVLLMGKPIHFMNAQKKIQATKDKEAQKQLKRNTAQSMRKSLAVYHVEYMKDESTHVMPVKDSDQADIGEMWIHQGIHCIESVLGSVSHTASYLRLWALSLAHDQLSTVLWNMVLGNGFTTHGFGKTIVLYIAFSFWAVLTLAILVVMEGLSAFLHTLRLHWVEFQSKFYSGSGEVFFPFRFETSRATD